MAQVFHLPTILYDGSVDVEFASRALGQYDFFKLNPAVNDTAWDSWYFDAVNPTTNESIFITLDLAKPQKGLPATSQSLYNTAIAGTYANGTSFIYSLESSEAIIIQRRDKSISVDFLNGKSDVSLRGSSTEELDLEFDLRINSPDLSIHGVFHVKSRTPPHLPCGPDGVNVSERLVPNLGWSNAIPIGTASVNLKIEDTELTWTGDGYHDKLWGSLPLSSAVLQSFYWGRASVGKYSVVWFVPRTQDGMVTTSSYVAHTDEGIILASCEAHAVDVHTWGDAKSTRYPPVAGTPPPNGMLLTFELGNEGKLKLNVTRDLFMVKSDTIYFMTGTVIGCVEGHEDEVVQGKAIWEVAQFDMS